ncbi:MAG TPA: YdcF family protein [Vicinamibacteria bacterium]|jgi:uncharacterized SAM-binding protein YcdF (DUF218 family)
MRRAVLLVCRILGSVALGGLAVSALTPVSDWLVALYAEQPRLEPADAVIVLGAGYSPNSLGDHSLQRLVQGVRLQRRGLAPLLALSGQAPAGQLSEVELRARYARDLGVPSAAIVALSPANTTREEAVRARAELWPRGVRSILLVSGSLHLVRARAVFEREGFRVFPAPADISFSFGSRAAQRVEAARSLLRELAGQAYYRLAGHL